MKDNIRSRDQYPAPEALHALPGDPIGIRREARADLAAATAAAGVRCGVRPCECEGSAACRTAHDCPRCAHAEAAKGESDEAEAGDGVTILLCIAFMIGMVIAMCLVSRHVARIVGSALLAHADGIDAYRRRASERAGYWFEQSVTEERPALVQLERRAAGDR